MKKLLVLLLLLLGIGAVQATDYNYGQLSVTMLNQDPDPAQPGEYVELRFKVEKEGNAELEDIKFELEPNFPFSFDSSDSPVKELGDWKVQTSDSQFYTLYYKLRVDKNALEDDYNLTLTQTSSNGITTKRDISIRVGEPQDIELSVGSVKTSPQELVPDYEDGVVEVELVNIGEENAYQVVSTMMLVDGVEESFGYSNRDSLGTIEAGASKTAQFYIDTLDSLEAGVHETQLIVEYKDNDDNTMNTLEIPFELRVFGKPQYTLDNVNVTSGLVGGMSGELFITLNNFGEQDADVVSIQVFKDSSQPFDFDERSDYIGKLDSGDSGQALFNFDVDEGAAPKDYRITLQIRSVVNGDVFVEEKEVVIPVAQGEPQGSNTLLFSLIGMLIAGGVGYFIGLKRKK